MKGNFCIFSPQMFVNVWWFILLIICSEVTGISKNISPHTWGYTQVQTFYIKTTDRNKVLLKLLRLCRTLWNKFTRFIFKTLWDVLFRLEIDTRCGRSWNNLHFLAILCCFQVDTNILDGVFKQQTGTIGNMNVKPLFINVSTWKQ